MSTTPSQGIGGWIDRLPWGALVLFAVLLGLAPFTPEPHLVEKLRLLAQGRLERPIDVFDLLFHAAPLALIAIKLWRRRAAGGKVG